MTHEQRAKKILYEWHLAIYGFQGSDERRKVDELYHHLKEAVKSDLNKS